MAKAVFCLASSDEQAGRIINNLLAQFSSDDISILYPDNKGYGKNELSSINGDYSTPAKLKKGSLTTEKNSKAPEGAAAGATAGGVLGGTLGLLAGIGALAIPGVGPFIAAGPIMAALSGSALGGSLGLLLGSIIGAGIPELEAKKFEAGLKQGNILIAVHTDSDDEIKHASDIMKKAGGKDICSTREKTGSRY